MSASTRTASQPEWTRPPVVVLQGSEGFVTYCTSCDCRVTPGPWPRATLQAAVADRIAHLRVHPD